MTLYVQYDYTKTEDADTRERKFGKFDEVLKFAFQVFELDKCIKTLESFLKDRYSFKKDLCWSAKENKNN